MKKFCKLKLAFILFSCYKFCKYKKCSSSFWSKLRMLSDFQRISYSKGDCSKIFRGRKETWFHSRLMRFDLYFSHADLSVSFHWLDPSLNFFNLVQVIQDFVNSTHYVPKLLNFMEDSPFISKARQKQIALFSDSLFWFETSSLRMYRI